MANPRVFISSTCYDLSEVRDTLVDFVTLYGFEAVLSERGDVFYHPDIHTHDSCLYEVGNCQLMILIIGGRFGGSYVADTAKSIVNAEYSAAREQKTPVFTFIKRNVYSDHFVFLKNKKGNHLKNIVFPSIDNNDHAEKIFRFIDEVRLSPVNNGCFQFDFSREIVDLLRKQWAGMFYHFLQERSAREQFQTTTNLLGSISEAGAKVEELVKRLYRHIDTTGADATIEDVESQSVVRKFFEEIQNGSPIKKLKIDSSIIPSGFEYWYDYIAKATGGNVEYLHDGAMAIGWEGAGFIISDPNIKSHENFSNHLQKRFDIIKKMDQSVLNAVISQISK